jgi:ESCRT-I complex subunit TSG101
MAAVAPLRAQQAALQNAYSRLQSELGELQQLDAALASNEQVLKGAMVEADRVMEDARRRKAPDVDDVLVAPTIVGGQLYTLAAEEKGIADALFVLGRALDKGRVSTDVFVKVSAFTRRYFKMRPNQPDHSKLEVSPENSS